MSLTVVRDAVLDDIDWLVEELRQLQEFFGKKHSLFGNDENSLRERLEMSITRHKFFIAEHSVHGRIGLIAGVVTPHLYNPEVRVLAEMFWWVVPAHRRTTKAASMLLDEFISWGKKNVDWITFGIQEKTPIKEDSLIRLGFRLQERAYLMEV